MADMQELCEHCGLKAAHFQTEVRFITMSFTVVLCDECEELLRLEPGEYTAIESVHLKF